MTIKTLDTVPFDTLIQCFFKSFENYYVQMPQDKEYFKNRWEAANVKYDLSFGMFDGDKLVGFIIHAIDNRNGELISYNSGTGVIPEYRGKKIVKSIYDYALNELSVKEIKKHTLEVITENEVAIKAYKGVGFNICKKYLCFSGDLKLEYDVAISLKKVDHNYFNWNSMNNQQYYSWDNHYQSLEKADFDYYLVLKNDMVQSYFVINAENGYLAQFDLIKDDATWSDLFVGIQNVNQTIRMNNVDDRLVEKVDFLNKIGLENTINQYEMEYTL